MALALTMAFLLLAACAGPGDTAPVTTDRGTDDTTTSIAASVPDDGGSTPTTPVVDDLRRSSSPWSPPGGPIRAASRGAGSILSLSTAVTPRGRRLS